MFGFSKSVPGTGSKLDYELRVVLKNLMLLNYVENFEKGMVTYQDLGELDEEDLQKLIPDKIPRDRLKRFIRENFFRSSKNGWEIDQKIVEPGEKEIGGGAFATVRTGDIKVGSSSITCALKEIRIDGKTVTKEKVINEVKIMSNCHHENILKTFGCFFSNKDRHATICLEYLPEGDLLHFGREYDTNEVQRLNFVVEIAKGIAYLHSKGIVHRDLKPANILVFHNKKTLKIADFGCSKIESKTSGSITGTPVYLAPELYHGTATKSDPKKLDVYAFGIMMWEILCDKMYLRALQRKYRDNIIGLLKEIHEKKKKTIQPDCFDKEMRKYKDYIEISTVMQQCFSFDPQDRPKMIDVLITLSTTLKKMRVDYGLDEEDEN